MFLNKPTIDPQSLVAGIVKQNHHAADIFRKYDIEFCCGGNWPIGTVCDNKGLKFENLRKELEQASRVVQIQPSVNYRKWTTDFLIGYITNIHHQFLYATLPDTSAILKQFVDGHHKQYPQMKEVLRCFQLLADVIVTHLQYEEATIFPYIQQITHAHENKDSYARLLVKTLRKPLNDLMKYEDEYLLGTMLKIRQLTDGYAIGEKSCLSHRVSLARLQDLDNDLMQHIYLENEVLYPRALMIESALLT